METRSGLRICFILGALLVGSIILGIFGFLEQGKKTQPIVTYQGSMIRLGTASYPPARWIYQTDAVVGHGGDSPEHPSHFMVAQDNSQITITECPAGDCSAPVIYTVPYQFPNETIPVTLAFRDIDHSGTLDMLVVAGTQTFVFLNDGTRFILRR
jgi:hypothetical protein